MIKKIILFVCILLPTASQAWEHEISIGYGGGREIGETYSNSGVFINAVLYNWGEVDKTLIFTVDGSTGLYYATTSNHKTLATASISPAFRAYFAKPEEHHYRPFLLLSSGPVYLSNRTFGTQTQGSNFALQTVLGGGLEIGDPKAKHNYSISWRFVHICNAGVFTPNQGFDVYNIVSLGWTF